MFQEVMSKSVFSFYVFDDLKNKVKRLSNIFFSQDYIIYL